VPSFGQRLAPGFGRFGDWLHSPMTTSPGRPVTGGDWPVTGDRWTKPGDLGISWILMLMISDDT